VAERAAPATLRRAKIVATVGPATDDLQVLTQMMHAGVDVVRLNASHGTVEDRRRRLGLVREAARLADRCVGVLLDLGGPKIRIEGFREGRVLLTEGAPFTLDTALDPKAGTLSSVGVAYKDLPRDVEAGDALLLADGQIVLDVVSVSATTVETRVRVGGELSDRKGLNRQGGGISAPAVSARDREDIRFAAEEAVDYVVSAYEHDIGPMRGAKLVARAWSDPGFKARLLENASEAAKEVGVQGFVGENVMAVENTRAVHNVVCCTLCSCYPWAVLGLPPTWYKSPEYRSRIVREPRAVLADFGLDVPQGREIRVWDSSSDMRYMVVPERPEGTEGLSEEQLAELVTRDSMIGTGLPKAS